MHSGLALLFPALLAIGLVASTRRSQARRVPVPIRLAERIWVRRTLAIAGSDQLAGVLVLLIIILVTLNLILLFPNLGAVIEQCNQF
jgi:hypothetical protein